MSILRSFGRPLVLVAALGVAACDLREKQPQLDGAAPTPPGSVAVPAVAPAATPAPSPVDPTSLQKGLDQMMPLVVERKVGFKPVEPTPGHRLLLHPGEKMSAGVTFNVSGLKQLTMSPLIEDFSAVSDCAGSEAAGVVDLVWGLDDEPKQTIRMDRNYREVVEVPVKGHSRLNIQVSSGNDVIWCDWATVGFFNIENR